jgi:plastocyanin domain-containing protein
MVKNTTQNKNNNTAMIFLGIAMLCVIGLLVVINSLSANNAPQTATTDVVSMVDGKQIVEVTVRGGYFPDSINAKAGVPTILRMKSAGTYGCERALRIPNLNISKTLPATGNTDIVINAQSAGTTIKGTCSMGMYNFAINFN